MRYDPDKLPLSADEIEAAQIRAGSLRVEAIRKQRQSSLHGDEASALEVHKAWKPVTSKK